MEIGECPHWLGFRVALSWFVVKGLDDAGSSGWFTISCHQEMNQIIILVVVQTMNKLQ
jgi:hypothetical protein